MAHHAGVIYPGFRCMKRLGVFHPPSLSPPPPPPPLPWMGCLSIAGLHPAGNLLGGVQNEKWQESIPNDGNVLQWKCAIINKRNKLKTVLTGLRSGQRQYVVESILSLTLVPHHVHRLVHWMLLKTSLLTQLRASALN